MESGGWTKTGICDSVRNQTESIWIQFQVLSQIWASFVGNTFSKQSNLAMGQYL